MVTESDYLYGLKHLPAEEIEQLQNNVFTHNMPKRGKGTKAKQVEGMRPLSTRMIFEGEPKFQRSIGRKLIKLFKERAYAESIVDVQCGHFFQSLRRHMDALLDKGARSFVEVLSHEIKQVRTENTY